MLVKDWKNFFIKVYLSHLVDIFI